MGEMTLGPVSWERMIRAVEKVRERLLRTAAALEAAGVPYAVVGGNAVAAWVSRVDESLVRNTRDVNVIIRRADFEAAKTAMTAAGFLYRHSAGLDMFLDGPGTKDGDAVHVYMAGERVRPTDPAPALDQPGGLVDELPEGLAALLVPRADEVNHRHHVIAAVVTHDDRPLLAPIEASGTSGSSPHEAAHSLSQLSASPLPVRLPVRRGRRPGEGCSGIAA